MKFALIQPYYSMEFDKVDESFEALLGHMDKCDETMDVIVLPEYSDVPGNTRSKAEFEMAIEKNNGRLMEKAAETAIRCKATVFVNASYKTELGFRNTTHVIDESGKVIGRYFKVHPAPSEVRHEEEGGYGLDVDYSYERTEPYVIEVDGVRYGFLTCYDFYFYEAFPTLARANIDVIIGCSLQRSDSHNALEIFGRFLTYHTNAYLVRASVSLGEDSEICGSSMVVSPEGKMLLNMKSDIGIATCEIDPNEKYYKPAGFGGKMKAHYEYIEEGRRPWNYRPSGSAVVKPDACMGYPRVCAHRGFPAVAPENTMPAFGAAVALGADEIEFDLWPTRDGEIVTCHDEELSRISTGSGKVYEHTYKELLGFDFGAKFDKKFEGVKIVRFEELLSKFACLTVMNIHIKPLSMTEEYPRDIMEKIISLIRRYDCEKYVYFMLESDAMVRQFKECAPDIPVCVGHLFEEGEEYTIVDRAIALGAEKVQFYKPYFNKKMIDKAHAHGIVCNICQADSEDEARRFVTMGIDTVLTDDCNRILNAVKER